MAQARTVPLFPMSIKEGNGFLTIRLFISLKSLTTLTVLSFFGMMKVGEAHSESACHFSTLKSHSLWISFFKVSTCFFGIGNSLP